MPVGDDALVALPTIMSENRRDESDANSDGCEIAGVLAALVLIAVVLTAVVGFVRALRHQRRARK